MAVLTSVTFPRRVKQPFRSEDERLVIFTDASSQAQAAVAYLWCSNDQRQAGRIWAAKQKGIILESIRFYQPAGIGRQL